MVQKKAVVFAFAVMCGFSCVNASEQDNDGMRSFIEFNNSIATFPYQASSKRSEAVTGGFSKLQLGQTKEQVKSILGEPDFASYIYLAGPPKKFMTCKWVYNLYKTRAQINDPSKDKVVQVHFGEDEKVKSLLPMNLAGLEAQGLGN